jgi:hypothetical protein
MFEILMGDHYSAPHSALGCFNHQLGVKNISRLWIGFHLDSILNPFNRQEKPGSVLI